MPHSIKHAVMTLHTPVPAVDLALHPRPLFTGDSPFQSACTLLMLAGWRPQALAHYDEAMRSPWNSAGLAQQMRRHYALSLLVAALLGHIVQLALLSLLVLASSGVPSTTVVANAGWSLLIGAAIAAGGLICVHYRRQASVALLWVLFLQGVPAFLFLLSIETAARPGSALQWHRLLTSLYIAYWVGLFAAIGLAANHSKLYDVRLALLLAAMAGFGSALNVARNGERLFATEWSVLFAWVDILLALLLGAGALLAGILRIDDWLVALPTGPENNEIDIGKIRRVTPLPLPGLDGLLENWLDYDWAKAGKVLQEIWRETRQQTAVRHALERTLEEVERSDKEKLIERLSVLIDNEPGMDWRMLLMRPTEPSVWQLFWAPLHEPVVAAPKNPSADKVNSEPDSASPAKAKRLFRRRQQWMGKWSQPLEPAHQPADRAYRRILAVFWYLSRGYISNAGTAGKEIDTGLKFGAELRELAAAYVALWEVERISRTPWIKALSPAAKDRRRKVSWETIDRFHSILQWEWLAERSLDPRCRTETTAQIDRLLTEIDKACHHDLPAPERRIVATFLEEWHGNICLWRSSAHPRLHVPRLAANPFFFMEPLRAEEKLYGRKAEIAEIARAWSRGNYQTVLLCGQPRIGKSSLILNAGRDAATAVRVARVQLDHVRSFGRAIEQILKEMVIAAHQTRHTGREEIIFRQPLWDADPFSECTHQLSQICNMGRFDIILSFDDLDSLAAQMAGTGGLQQLLEYLVHLHQTIERLGIVFLISSRPHLFYAWSGNPFAQGIRVIGLSRLDDASIGDLLNKPMRSHGHRFHPDTESLIYALSDGHPWVAELMAHFVVEGFNHRVDAGQATAPDPLFLPELLQEALASPTLASHIADFAGEMLAYVRKHLTASEATETEQLLPVMARYDHGSTLAALYAAQNCTAPDDEDRVNGLLVKLAELELIEIAPPATLMPGGPCWRIPITLLARHWSGRPLTGP